MQVCLAGDESVWKRIAENCLESGKLADWLSLESNSDDASVDEKNERTITTINTFATMETINFTDELLDKKSEAFKESEKLACDAMKAANPLIVECSVRNFLGNIDRKRSVSGVTVEYELKFKTNGFDEESIEQKFRITFDSEAFANIGGGELVDLVVVIIEKIQEIINEDNTVDEITCTCENGIPGINCSKQDTEVCESCNSGYHLDSHTCVKNICSCENGSPVNDCSDHSHHDHFCETCFEGFHLENNVCVKNECRCENGILSLDCPEHETEACASCADGYHLSPNGI